MNTRLDVDLLVVGGGPAGLYATYYAGFRGMSCALVDSLPQLGGQVMAMYPEKPIFDVAGLPGAKGKDLIRSLVVQAESARPHLLLGEHASALEHLDGSRRFRVPTSAGNTVDCSSIVITGGIGRFTPRRLPSVDRFLGCGAEHFVRDPDVYSGQDVIVVGGGDSAVDWCLLLESFASSVTLVHRREMLTAHELSVKELHESSAEVLTSAQITAAGEDDHLRWIEITSEAGVDRRDVDAVIVAMGFTANLGPLLKWGIDIENRRFIPVDSAMRTSLSGIYAAGDITAYPGKVRLISVGFGEAATAVNNAAHDMCPDDDVFPGHSTDRLATSSPEGTEEEHGALLHR